jgi:hypothetical protein
VWAGGRCSMDGTKQERGGHEESSDGGNGAIERSEAPERRKRGRSTRRRSTQQRHLPHLTDPLPHSVQLVGETGKDEEAALVHVGLGKGTGAGEERRWWWKSGLAPPPPLPPFSSDAPMPSPLLPRAVGRCVHVSGAAGARPHRISSPAPLKIEGAVSCPTPPRPYEVGEATASAAAVAGPRSRRRQISQQTGG